MENSILWQQYKNLGSLEIRRNIMRNYINLVHYVIHRSKFIQLNVIEKEDYFQFGIEGLAEAVDRFNPDLGIKFETYAIQRIRGKIIDELRKLQIKPRTLSNEEAGVKYSNISIDAPLDDENNILIKETLASNSPEPNDEIESSEKIEILLNLIKSLPEREQIIITLSYFENLNYTEIAEILGLTVSRVSQIQKKIIKELKAKIEIVYN